MGFTINPYMGVYICIYIWYIWPVPRILWPAPQPPLGGYRFEPVPYRFRVFLSDMHFRAFLDMLVLCFSNYLKLIFNGFSMDCIASPILPMRFEYLSSVLTLVMSFNPFWILFREVRGTQNTSLLKCHPNKYDILGGWQVWRTILAQWGIVFPP